MHSVVTSTQSLLAQSPRWVTVLALTLIAVLALYIGAKLLKWSLYLLLIIVLVSGLGYALWLWLH